MNLQSFHPLLLADWLMAPKASDVAGKVHWLYYFLVSVSAFFFVAIVLLMVLFAVRYRRRSPHERARKTPTHHLGLELAWSLPPLVIVLFVFAVGVSGFLEMTGPRANALEIRVNARRWAWEFEYRLPDGSTFRTDELHLEVGRPVVLTLTSEDVIHSLWIPAFAVKRDAVPGRYNKLAFTPTVTSKAHGGPFPLLCTEYCGKGHSTMLSTVTVHESGMFAVWLKQAARTPLDELKKRDEKLYRRYLAITTEQQMAAFLEEIEQLDPALRQLLGQLQQPALLGAQLFQAKGCAQCHSIDGTRLTGPTMKGLWGRSVLFTDGTQAVADENYIRQSILDPMARIVETFQGVMPTFKGKLSDQQIDAIIAYIRSLDRADDPNGKQAEGGP